jgi:uncharacterized protein YndB with AHSA1/START domain
MISNLLKWVLPVIAILVVAGLFTRKTFHVEAVIPAAPHEVWKILMDTEAYPDWNPVFVHVQGDYVQGGKVRNKVRDPEGKFLEMSAAVKNLTENRELRQTGGLFGVITFDHRWRLEPVQGGSKVTQHEVDRGLYLWFWNSDWIEPAYAQVLVALENRLTDTQ